MHSAYDWATLAVFASLAVLFLQRSTVPEPIDSTWHYLLPAIGCGTSNWLGNAGHQLSAIMLLALTSGYIILVLWRPVSSG